MSRGEHRAIKPTPFLKDRLKSNLLKSGAKSGFSTHPLATSLHMGGIATSTNTSSNFPTFKGGFTLKLTAASKSSFSQTRHYRKYTDTEANQTAITVNLTHCRYPVVHEEVIRRGWKVITREDDQTAPWDLFWADTAQPVEYFKGLELYQKVNHFPGMFNIHRKNHLAEHLEKMRKHFPDLYDFYPKTWLLPKDHPDVQLALKKNKVLIAKPCDQSQGRGIFLLTDVNDLAECSGKKLVVQEYIDRPLIHNNLKFDLRIYVLVAGCDPLRLYIFEDGLVRFATESYERPTSSNKRDKYKHLTNYAVNKLNKNFHHAKTEKEDEDENSEEQPDTGEEQKELNASNAQKPFLRTHNCLYSIVSG